jgi:hypothetical protein
MIRSAQRLALSAAAAALAFAGMIATSTGASAAVVASHFQQQATLVCSSGCVAKFGKLAANQALDIQHVACEVSTAGDVILATFALIPDSLNFSVPLGLVWQRKALGFNAYTFSAETNMRVPFGGQAQVGILASGSPAGKCSIIGTKYTSN